MTWARSFSRPRVDAPVPPVGTRPPRGAHGGPARFQGGAMDRDAHTGPHTALPGTASRFERRGLIYFM